MKIKFHKERCTLCKKCIDACIDWHEDGAARLSFVGESANLKFRVCTRCPKTACAYACTYGLIYRDKEYGTLKVISEECQACHACVNACPFNAVHINPADDTAVICDLCDGNPQCVLICPEKALELIIK